MNKGKPYRVFVCDDGGDEDGVAGPTGMAMQWLTDNHIAYEYTHEHAHMVVALRKGIGHSTVDELLRRIESGMAFVLQEIPRCIAASFQIVQ